jgi:hypothetical protein
LKISPLMAAPGGDLLIHQISAPEEAERLINGNVNLPSLAPELRSSLLASTRLVVFIGVPATLEQGLAPLTGKDLAAGYACSSYAWYLVCSARLR